jgi:hypothetical protein
MNAHSIILNPIRHGWAVQLTDGRELARFLGPGSRWRALRHVARITGRDNRSTRRPIFPTWSGAYR